MSVQEDLVNITYVTLIRIGIPVCAVFGIIGNCLSIAVFCNKKMRSPFTLLLIALGVFDSFFLLARLILFGIGILPQDVPVWINVIHVVALPCSTFTTVAISFERYNAIVHPFKKFKEFNNKKTAWIIFGVFVLSIILNIPELYKHVVLGDTKFYYILWLAWDSVWKVILPLFLTAWLNVSIYWKIKSIEKTRARLTNGNATDGPNIKKNILLAVVLVFAFCYLPFTMLVARELYVYMVYGDVYFYVVGGTGTSDRNANWVRLCIHIWIIFTGALNSSVNFLIYFFVGRKFRCILAKYLSCVFRCEFGLKNGMTSPEVSTQQAMA